MKILTEEEVFEIEKDILNAKIILSTYPFDIEKAKVKIYEINRKHPENKIANKIVNGLTDNGFVSYAQATAEDCINDLKWKIYYLSLKAAGKTLEEIGDEWSRTNCLYARRLQQ